MADNLGVASGLIGRDTTNLDPKLLAIMAMRREKSNTPTWSQQDALKAINERFKGMDDKTRDSISNTFNHKAYIDHLDSIGMQVVPKPKQ